MMQGTHNEKRERKRYGGREGENYWQMEPVERLHLIWPFGTTSMIALPEGSETKRGT